MKYPSISEFIKTNFSGGEVSVDETFDLISVCIEQVFNEEESWTALTAPRKN